MEKTLSLKFKTHSKQIHLIGIQRLCKSEDKGLGPKNTGEWYKSHYKSNDCLWYSKMAQQSKILGTQAQ